MGATILGCGHASHLFEADYLDGHPQVHLHYLTEDEEFKAQGYGRVELVCHGCGVARLVLYDESRTHQHHIKLRDDFRDQHRKCPNNGFETKCPDYRRAIEVFDIRRSARPVKKEPRHPRRPKSAR